MDRRAVFLSTCTLLVLLGAPTNASAQGAWCARLQGGGENCGFATFEQCRANVSGVGGTCIANPRSRNAGPSQDRDILRGTRAFERREFEYGRRELEYGRRQIEERRERDYEQQRRQSDKKRGNPPVGGNFAKDGPPPAREVTAPPVVVTKPTQTPYAPPVVVSKPAPTPAPDKDKDATAPAVVSKPTLTPPSAPVVVTKPAQTPPAAEMTSTAPNTPAPGTSVTTPSPDTAATTTAPVEPAATSTGPTQTASAPTTSPSTAPSPAAPARDIDVSEVDTSVAPTLSSEDTRRVQTALKGRGFDPGPIDGVLNPQTQVALRTFQTTYGITARGVVDSQTLLALGEAELASRPAK